MKFDLYDRVSFKYPSGYDSLKYPPKHIRNVFGTVIAVYTDKRSKTVFYLLSLNENNNVYLNILSIDKFLAFNKNIFVEDFKNYCGRGFAWMMEENLVLEKERIFCQNCNAEIYVEKEFCWACEHGV